MKFRNTILLMLSLFTGEPDDFYLDNLLKQLHRVIEKKPADIDAIDQGRCSFPHYSIRHTYRTIRKQSSALILTRDTKF